MTLKKWRFQIAIAVLALVSSAKAATREEIVTSVFGGQPYLIAYQDETGSSKLEPGVFIRAAGGAGWEPIFSGTFFPQPIAGGLNLQLAMGKVSDRYESLAVWDGKILLFHIGSRQADPKSYVIPGTAEWPVVDGLTGEKYGIPSLDSIDDVSFFERMSEDGAQSRQVILVSIRLKNSPMGKGMTFAMVVDPLDGFDERGIKSAMKLAYQPLLLDWDFHKKAELSGFIQNLGSHEAFISDQLLSRLSAGKVGEPAPLTEWRDFLAQSAGAHGAISRVGLKKMPAYNLRDGKIAVDQMPSRVERIGGLNALAVFDPLSGRSGIYSGFENISLADLSKVRPLIHGDVACQDSKLCIATEPEALFKNALSVAQMHDGRVYAITSIGVGVTKRLDALLLQSSLDGAEKKVSSFNWFVPPEAGWLLISWKFEDGSSSTVLYELDATGAQMRIKTLIEICKDGFTKAELSQRYMTYGGTRTFDALTPHVVTDEEYGEQHRLTLPHIDLDKTLKGVLKLYLPKPKLEKDLGNNLIFREYETIAGVEALTGIYTRASGTPASDSTEFVTEGSNSFIRLMRGNIFEVPDLAKDGYIMADEVLNLKSPSNLELKIRFILGGTQVGEVKKANPVFLIQSNSLNATSLILSEMVLKPEDVLKAGFVKVEVDPDDSSKDADRAIDGDVSKDSSKKEKKEKKEKDKSSRKTRILFYIVTAKGTTLGEFRVDVVEDSQKKAELRPAFMWKTAVETRDVPPDEILNRLMLDQNGQLYWVRTPHVERRDEKFTVLKLEANGQNVRPSVDRSLKLRGIDEDPGLKKDAAPKRGVWRVSESVDQMSSERRDRLNRLKRAPEFKTDVFPKFREVLDDLANPEKPARHVVLIVPADLQRYGMDYPDALRTREQNRPAHWSASNDQHEIYGLPATSETIYQGEVLKNLVTMREVSERRRPVLITPIDRVREVGRPAADDIDVENQQAFQIVEQRVGDISVSIQDNSGATQAATERKDWPHTMYLLSTEGKRTELNQYRPNSSPHQVSMVMIGTQQSWDTLKGDLSFESSYGLLQDFEVISLESPTVDVRVQFALENVLRNPAIRGLGYQIAIEDIVQDPDLVRTMTAEDAERKMMESFVRRADGLATHNKMPVFETFMRALNDLAVQLTTNPEIRQERKINSAVLDRVLSHIYPMPLDLRTLPPNHPLKIISQPDADFQWQQSGSHHDYTTKDRIIRLIARALSADPRNIPASGIIVGESGSGKTSLMDTLFKWLGLQRWDFDKNKGQNANARVFFLNLAEVISGKGMASATASERQTLRTFDQVTRAFEDYLSNLNGDVGFIFLDDFHFGTEEVRAWFWARLRQLQDSKTYTTIDGQERPTRNLIPIIAINPSRDLEKLKRFTDTPWKAGMVEHVLAQISNDKGELDGKKVEPSSILRYGDVIPLREFLSSAKGPTLQNQLRENQLITLNSSRLVFVAPEAIRKVIAEFPKSDARTFLSAAPNAFLALPSGDQRIFIVGPRRYSSTLAPVKRKTEMNPWDETSPSDESIKIEQFITGNFQAVSVDSGFSGKLEFLQYVLGNFRLKAFGAVMQAIRENRNLMRNEVVRNHKALTLFQAIARHLEIYPDPTLSQVLLDPADFNAVARVDRDKFLEAAKRITEFDIAQHRETPEMPRVGEVPPQNVLATIGMGSFNNTDSRQYVLRRTMEKLDRVAAKLAQAMLRVKSLDSLPRKKWLTTEVEEPKIAQEISADIDRVLSEYLQEIFNSRISAVHAEPLSQYDAMRLFVIALDRSFHRLPWSKITEFMVGELVGATRDASIGQSSYVQDLIFKAPTSMLVTVDRNMILGLAQSMPRFDESSDEERLSHERFSARCTFLLARSQAKDLGSKP